MWHYPAYTSVSAETIALVDSEEVCLRVCVHTLYVYNICLQGPMYFPYTFKVAHPIQTNL